VLGAEHAGERIDKVLARLVPDTSRATIQRWIGEGRVLVEGKPCRTRDAVVAGSLVEVRPAPGPPSEALPDASVEFAVLHEDAHLIVVNKPAGLVVHPARGHKHGTLVNGLLARPGFEAIAGDPLDRSGALRPGIVHRLDKDTSGVLVVAKDERSREGLKRQLFEHAVERVYRALTAGTPRAATFRTLHARDPRSRLRFTSKTLRGKRAVTHVRPLETLARTAAALIECRLDTGRTHQIRVHLAEQARTPVFADRLYGGWPTDPELSGIAEELGHQALHAEVLGFVHPVTGVALRFEAPLPADFARALERLRAIK
jgi:23S rRNA pseudouridine1911/1915/1917 synthase